MAERTARENTPANAETTAAAATLGSTAADTNSSLAAYPKAEEYYRPGVSMPSQEELVSLFRERLNAAENAVESAAQSGEGMENRGDASDYGPRGSSPEGRGQEPEYQEDELDRELRRSRRMGRVFGILTAVLLAAAVVLVLLVTVGRNTVTGAALRVYFGRYPFMRNPVSAVADETRGEVFFDGSTTMGRAIAEKAPLGINIGTIRETPSLRFDVERDYGVKNITQAITFDDAIWYINDGTEVVHYAAEMVGTAIDYYSKLNDRMNHDSSDVLKLIEPKSRLLGTVTAIRSDPVVIHTLKELEIGELRRFGDNFYLMVRLTGETNDGKPQTKTVEVMRLVAVEKEARVAEIAEVK